RISCARASPPALTRSRDLDIRMRLYSRRDAARSLPGNGALRLRQDHPASRVTRRSRGERDSAMLRNRRAGAQLPPDTTESADVLRAPPPVKLRREMPAK